MFVNVPSFSVWAAAGKKKSPPEELCKLFKAFLAVETKFVKGLEQNSATCGVPADVLKQVKGGELVRAIRAVGQGQSLLDPAVTSAVLDRLRKGKHLLQDERLARLSPQEERILQEVADGKTNREIGDDLKLAEKTVKNYVSSILSKLEVARRAEAAAYLARHTTTPGEHD